MLTRSNLFSTPVFSIGLTEYKEINPPLINKIYELQQNDQGVVKSNILGWQSSGSLNNLKEFERLKNMLDILANKIMRELGYNTDLVLGNSWASINPKHASNQIHDHANSFLSGAYYLKVPQPVSPINFYDPRPVKVFFKPESSLVTDYSSEVATFEPREGLILFFPSWLKHSVGLNLSEQDRISLSFNYYPVLGKH